MCVFSLLAHAACLTDTGYMWEKSCGVVYTVAAHNGFIKRPSVVSLAVFVIWLYCLGASFVASLLVLIVQEIYCVL